jgi:hypothetical protein
MFSRNTGRIAAVESNAENMMEQPGTYENYRYQSNYYNRQTGANQASRNEGKCFNCEENGHRWKECSKPKRIFCYKCGTLGFFTKYCNCQQKNN